MPTALEQLNAFLEHPNPGLVFDAHERAGAPERAYETPHAVAPTPPPGSLEELKRLIGSDARAFQDLVDVYSAYEGVQLFTLYDDLNEMDIPAVTLLPILFWEEATEPWKGDGELASFLEECPMFTKGDWRVIAYIGAASMVLAMFFNGEYEGKPLAGRMFCMGLDGVLGFEDELAPSYRAFMAELTGDPVAFFNRISFTWTVTGNGSMFGDVIGAYVPDVTGHASLTAWKR